MMNTAGVCRLLTNKRIYICIYILYLPFTIMYLPLYCMSVPTLYHIYIYPLPSHNNYVPRLYWGLMLPGYMQTAGLDRQHLLGSKD